MNKLIMSAALGFMLSACAHERTEMDRELALKLVDKAGRIEIVQTGNPIVQVTAPAAGQPWLKYQDPAPVDTRTNCINSPVYTVNGTFLNYVRDCTGAQ